MEKYTWVFCVYPLLRLFDCERLSILADGDVGIDGDDGVVTPLG